MLGEFMTNRLKRMAGIFCFCTLMAAAVPSVAYADETETEAAAETESEYQTSSEMLVKVEDINTNLYASPDEEAEVIGQAEAGSTYTVLEMVDGEWVKISNGDSEGYINTVTSTATVAENVEEVVVNVSEKRRQEIVDYALQFVGNRYVYGGRDPHTGVDCSGFTSYVMRHAAGVELAHSSRSQANQGRAISAAEIRPGDIICYASGKSVNHVALYIGDGKIVHASNERNGILISDWNYRNPYRIVNVLGD